MEVVVLSKSGKVLMPCTPAKAKHLLKAKKAKVVRLKPFTIELKFASTEYLQIPLLKKKLEDIKKFFGLKFIPLSKRKTNAKGKPKFKRKAPEDTAKQNVPFKALTE